MLHMGTTHTVNDITVIILVFSVGQCLSPVMMGCIPHKYIHVKCISLFFFFCEKLQNFLHHNECEAG